MTQRFSCQTPRMRVVSPSPLYRLRRQRYAQSQDRLTRLCICPNQRAETARGNNTTQVELSYSKKAGIIDALLPKAFNIKLETEFSKLRTALYSPLERR